MSMVGKRRVSFLTGNMKSENIRKEKVFVGLSGGVDSSVAALLLKKKGYDVVGVYMKNWSDPRDLKTGHCTWIQDRRDAMRVASQLGIPFLEMDFEREYRKRVVQYLFDEYRLGRTPNPDVMCNKIVKFDLFLKKSLKLGASYIATGHYAKISGRAGHYALRIPYDKRKDQTYFLYSLTQLQLSKTLFPLSEMTKSEVRRLARKKKLITAEKKDSQGICFVGEVPIKEFLSKKLPEKKGRVVDTSGNMIGEHNGAYFYTIGQRHGFSIFNQTTDSKPHYVIEKDVKKNILIVDEGLNSKRLAKHEVLLKDVH